MLRLRPTRAAWFLLLALPALSCDGSLRLVVVEQGGSGNLALAGKAGETAGAPLAAGTGGTGGTLDEGALGGMPDSTLGGAGGVPDAPSWEAAPLYTASFVPYGFPEQYVRHLDGTGVIAVIDMASASEREAASFEMIPGMYERENEDGRRCLSFRAVNKIGTFFRHADSRIYLNAASDLPLFLADATFCEEPGMADPQAITFRTANYRNRVIHLRNVSELWIDEVPDPITPEFAAEATFYRTTALTEAPPLAP